MQKAFQTTRDMPETMENSKIIEEILNNPQARELRNTAGEITDIVFQARGKSVFFDDTDSQDSKDTEKEKIANLLMDFRKQILTVTGQDIEMTNIDLYTKIIYPLVMALADRAT